MNLISKALTLSFCISVFAGCAARVQGPKPVPVAENLAVPTSGRITLIRTEAEPSADEVLVYTNDVLLAVVGNQSFVELDLPAGNVVLTLDWDDTPMKFDEEIVLDTLQSTNIYITIIHKFDVPEISRKAGGTDYTMEETLVLLELPEKLATNVIRKLDPELSCVFDPVE